ncbi:MAG: hypothetical protein PUB10_09680 [Clostridiales bacterium]|nr:hypothetical protein [Clostridiales bacterium]
MNEETSKTTDFFGRKKGEMFETGILYMDCLFPIIVGKSYLLLGDRRSGKSQMMCQMQKNLLERGEACVLLDCKELDEKSVNQFLSENLVRLKIGSKSALIILDHIREGCFDYRYWMTGIKEFEKLSLLAVADTLGNDVSNDISTDIINYFDGQLFFDRKRFRKGYFPSVIQPFTFQKEQIMAYPVLQNYAGNIRDAVNWLWEDSKDVSGELFGYRNTLDQIKRRRAIGLYYVLGQEYTRCYNFAEEVMILFLANEYDLAEVPSARIGAELYHLTRHVFEVFPELEELLLQYHRFPYDWKQKVLFSLESLENEMQMC